ncbi:uncharacterized protein LOC129570592 [Sitodiplosis mosellana]|uniref:uncharacterized protein LOC129570592 n=1 Tax=Sitodiplosis mosellana TaxID=263140 RepID=UPI0024451E72|nr:uncharacterized protein LOC129570592 [Sitodiplosis mosellana]
MGNLSSKMLSHAKKRVRDDEPIKEVFEAKKPKIDSKQLQVLDINDDCLQIVFECLDLEDLFNVAEAHSHLVPAARMVFARRYRMKKVFLNLDLVRFIDDDCIEVRKDVAAAFFRYFGAVVSSLFINFEGQRERAIEQSLLDHCPGTLVKFELALCDTSNLDTIDEPFGKVEQLTITKSSLSKRLSRLYVWFPSLTTLKLINVTSEKPEYLVAHLPQLRNLVIYNEKMTIPLATISGMLRANPQLESLVLCCDYDADFLQSVSASLRRLIELELWAPDDRFLCFGDDKVRFESVETFALIAPHLRGEFVVNMPFEFTNLKELYFDGFNEFKGQLISFIKENHGVRQLNLVPCIDDWDDLTFADLMSVVNSLPDLVELEFCGDTFKMDDIIQLLMINKRLQKVRVAFIDMPHWPDFVDAIETEWTHGVYYNGDSTDVECYFFKLDRIEGGLN